MTGDLVRSRYGAALAVAIGVVVLGACSSGSSSSASSSTDTKAARGPTIDAFQVPAAADCATSPGHVAVEWKTTNATDVALFVDGTQAASGPYADGNDTLAVTCDGKQHAIRIDATKGDAKTSRSESVTTGSSGGGAAPTLCENSQGVGEGAVVAYGSHIGNANPQATVFSVRCAPATGTLPGEYAIVTLATQTASGRFRVLMLQPPPTANQGAAAIGYDTEEGAPPGFTYTDCALDPAALAALGLPALEPQGGPGTMNCPVAG
jgi:hypothetical protein